MAGEVSTLTWTARDRITHWLLFALAMLSGVHFGGEIFDSLVNDPVWSASVTASRQWEEIDPGRFYAIFSMVLLLVSLLTLFVGWRAQRPVRAWLRGGALLFISAVVVTLIYFLPEIIRIRGPGAVAIPDDELARRIARWIRLDTGREAMVLVGFMSTMHALGLSYRLRTRTETTRQSRGSGADPSQNASATRADATTL